MVSAVLEDVVSFVPGESHWSLTGADKPEWVVAEEERLAALPAPETDGVAEVKPRRRKRAGG